MIPSLRKLATRHDADQEPTMTDYAIAEPGLVYDEDATVETPIPEGVSRPERVSRSGFRAWTRWLEPASLVPTYVGVVVVAVGFVLIGIAWSQIAALTVVSLQMPYLVSAGFTGLALVMVGLIIINVAAKRQDGAERARQMQTLTETFQALQQEIAQINQPDRDRP